MSREWRMCSDFSPTPYPGEIPEGPFTISEGRVRPLNPEDAPSIEAFSPVPLLTYGSNACPGRLAEKFLPVVGSERDLSGIAVLPAVAHGVDAAWACQVNSRDAVPRTLAGVETGSLACHVLLLPSALLPRMDRTEGRIGRFYIAARLRTVMVDLYNGFRWEQPITYLGVGRRGPLCDRGDLYLCREYSEQEARRLIEAGSGSCDDAFLPTHTEVPNSVALSSLPAPALNCFF
jgi:hypothetical protein